jgi:Ca-activated chloride channel family protein
MSEFFAQFSQFHFLRPEWFYALVPLILLFVLKLRSHSNTQWHQVLPAHLAKTLLATEQQKLKQNKWLIPLLWLIAVAAMAGPTWQKIEKPVFQVKRASVIVMDMSMSMRSTDVKPNRLSKAKFKAIDLAKAIPDGEIALVAYAGDAFTISPLTPDSKNIVNLIPSLSPEIMPEAGSYPLLGLSKAAELLQQAGYVKGDIYWFTDGIDHEDMDGLNRFIGDSNYRVNIMAFGSAEGAPIQMLDQSLLKDHRGNIVIPKLNASQLAQLATVGGGVFVKSTATDIDVKTLLASQDFHQPEENEQQEDDKLLTGDDWQEAGPYLVLFLLPIVLFAFRRGTALPAVFLSLLMINPDASANESEQAAQTPPVSQDSWTDFVFNTKDQVASKAYQADEFAKAQQTFESPQWKGSAAYKAGDFEAALNYFQQDGSAQGLYNQGNALAQLGQFEDAIKAYENAIKLDTNHQDAKANKALLEQLQQQQEQQNQQQNQDQQQQQDQQGGQQQESDQQNQDQQQQNQQQDQGEQNQQPQPSGQPEQQESDQQSQNEQQGEESDSDKEGEQQQDSQSQPGEEQPTDEKQAKQQAAQMSPEQQADKEAQQKLEQLLRKVSDDPAVLLRNKMILESRKRQQNPRPPKGATKSW